LSGRCIDQDYRVVAKAHKLTINKVSGDEILQFPIEEVRMRSIFVSTVCTTGAVLIYGWLVEQRLVSNLR